MGEEKTDQNKKDWSRRFTDPMLMMKWKSEIRVEPAKKENGEFIGFRIYPDGTRERFVVE
jgi:hypothetical protein